MFILFALLAIVIGIITEAIWVIYIISSGKMTIDDKKSRRKTATFSALTGVMTILIGLLTFLEAWWCILVWIVGIWIGAYYSLHIKKWIENNTFLKKVL